MSNEVTATFIFTDLVDSTALASRVGPDATEAIREAHFGALRDAIGPSGGTEVKNLGDGLMVMFNSARRAVSCAVAMQQAIEVHNRRADEKLSIRVGVAVGEAVVEDGDYFGTPVIEAARLCAKCDGDQILVTATVIALAGSALAHETNPLGGLELKGLPRPVETVAILWEPEAVSTDGAGLPSRVSSVLTGTEPGFFGRHDELAVIADAAKTARAEQRPHLVAIAGEPGMGKTTLAARATHELAVGNGAIVTFGGCVDGLAAPFEPWIEAVRTLVDAWDTATIDAHLAAHGHVLGAWVHALAVPDAAPQAPGTATGDQLALFAGAADVLTRSAGERDLIVILDDLQWSDSASLQLLRYVLARESEVATLLLATYRDSDLIAHDPLTALLADFRREANVTRIDLAGLSDTEMVDFMASAAGHDLSDAGVELAHTLRTETKGNPFFTSAMVRHLVDTGTIAQGPSDTVEFRQSVADLGLPNSIREVVAHRVGRLGEHTSTVLNVAAVIGLNFDFDLLVSLVPFDDDDVLDLLEEAMTAALVTEDRGRPGQFGFVHGLVREALYQDLGMTRRARIHQQIAQSLEPAVVAGTVTPAAIATHLIAATRPNDVNKAVQYSMAAGDVAMTALAPVDAADWYRQALELHVASRDA
ncbi:MAG TPA: AAA family ATPase, partial [Acidimicrobiales bacterium]|nr:AAA family ATPase [Acidimicrobiales bacterium]